MPLRMPLTSAISVTLRIVPLSLSCSRFSTTMKLSPASINSGTFIGGEMILTIVSSGELAWMVPMLPSCPVFMAVKRVKASTCLTSPTMIRSGRMRKAFLVKMSMVSSPFSSSPGGLASNRIQWFKGRLSSAVSSMEMILSKSGMKEARMLRVVVLPLPVPPAIRMLAGRMPMPSTHIQRKAAASNERVFILTRSTME